MPLIIYKAVKTNPGEFVTLWSGRYSYSNQHLYDANIGKELSEARTIDLFTWKNGTTLSARKRASVLRNFVARIGELSQLPPTASAEQFLSKFEKSGAIWRVFWLHCWQPHKFPIYDQHVHRAMRFLQAGVREEIPAGSPKKIQCYVNSYLPFYSQFAELDSRLFDKALWAFGKFLSQNNFPIDPADGG